MKMKIVDDETLNNYKNTRKGDLTLQGVHSYDILANILYVDDF